MKQALVLCFIKSNFIQLAVNTSCGQSTCYYKERLRVYRQRNVKGCYWKSIQQLGSETQSADQGIYHRVLVQFEDTGGKTSHNSGWRRSRVCVCGTQYNIFHDIVLHYSANDPKSSGMLWVPMER
jgi:hypothetical protein